RRSPRAVTRTRPALLLDGDTIGGGEDHGTRADRLSADLYGHIGLTGTVLRALARVAVQCLDPEVDIAQRLSVTDGAVDDDSGPPVADGGFGDHIAHQSSGDRTVAVDDEHRAVTGLIEKAFDQGVVLKATDRARGAGE